MTSNALPHQDAQLKEIYAEAFRRWWQADYSIEGLRNKSVPSIGGKQASLYEYWFDSAHPPEIVKFAGRDWTKFHLPLHDLAGVESAKAAWTPNQVTAFYQEIFRREAEGVDRFEADAGLSEAARPRAFFNGVVFPANKATHSNPRWMPVYADAIFQGVAQFAAHSPGNAVDFRGAIFAADAAFNNRVFQILGDFENALFLSDAEFQQCQFAGRANFKGASFQGVTFEGAHFNAQANFSDTTFLGSADFTAGVSQDLILDGARFFGGAKFQRRDFRGWVRGSELQFDRDVTFRDCAFAELVRLEVHCRGSLDISSRTGGDFGSEVDFSWSFFGGDADFSGRKFLRATKFVCCKFFGVPKFYDAEPHPSTAFHASEFNATVGKPEETALKSKFAGWVFRWMPFGEWLPGMEYARQTRNASTKEFEDAYRTLRHLFEGDSEQAGRFYALEMDTRRSRTDVSVVERWVLFFFWLTSGYGRYIGRPLAVLFGAILVVTTFLWVMLAQVVWPDIPPRFEDIFAYVWRFFLLPAPFASGDGGKPYWLAAFVTRYPISYVLLCGICALITTGVVGVTLVTFRRRFALK